MSKMLATPSLSEKFEILFHKTTECYQFYFLPFPTKCYTWAVLRGMTYFGIKTCMIEVFCCQCLSLGNDQLCCSYSTCMYKSKWCSRISESNNYKYLMFLVRNAAIRSDMINKDVWNGTVFLQVNHFTQLCIQERKEVFYLTTHSTHFLFTVIWHQAYGKRTTGIVREETCSCYMGYSFRLAEGFFYMHHPTDRITHTTAFVTPVVEHWLEQGIVREETCCRHMGYSFQLAAMVLLYASSHRQDNTYHSLCYTSHGALACFQEKYQMITVLKVYRRKNNHKLLGFSFIY